MLHCCMSYKNVSIHFEPVAKICGMHTLCFAKYLTEVQQQPFYSLKNPEAHRVSTDPVFHLIIIIIIFN